MRVRVYFEFISNTLELIARRFLLKALFTKSGLKLETHYNLFSRMHMTLQPALSVGRLVGRLVGWLVTLYIDVDADYTLIVIVPYLMKSHWNR